MADHFDVFLSHNSRDKPAVIALAKRLKAHGLNVWLDAWELRPGHPWQEALEQIIETTKTAAVLVGGDGFGPWEDVEMRACLGEFVKNKTPVIPVLLPGCPKKPDLPLLLRAFTWVDLRDGQPDEGFYKLIWGITGVKPKELDEDSDSLPKEAPDSSGFGKPMIIQTPHATAAPAILDTPKPEGASARPERVDGRIKRVAHPARIPKAKPAPAPPVDAVVGCAPRTNPPHIHGWPAEKVQALQHEAAQSLGYSDVAFRHPLKSGGAGPAMAVIPAGSFVMGSPADEPERSDREGPQYVVSFARPFAMGVYALTFDEYDLYCKTAGNPLVSDRGWGRGRRPVINVSWQDAQAYCAWLSAQTGQNYRLPSEAEWEYACRAGTVTPFHWGSTITPAQANYDGTYTYSGLNWFREQTLPVDKFGPNAFGLYQMHGNVWEWCEDVWHDGYQNAPVDGSAWIVDGNQYARVARGGSWVNFPVGLRSAFRNYGDASSHFSFQGFRLVQD